MKPLNIPPITFKTFLLSAALLGITACKDQSPVDKIKDANTTQETSSAPATTNTPHSSVAEETPVSSDKAVAHFEAGLEAANANNMPLAYKEFLEAANEGHVFAQYNIGLMYEQGLGIDKNAEQAVNWYKKSAEQGNSAAQFNLGVCYENGIGTAVDFSKANEWYRKASEQGDGLAVGNLGMLYIRGQGVKVNKIAGIALLLMSSSMDTSPQNQARKNISSTQGLTPEMVSEAQALSAEMSDTNNILGPLDNYLNISG
ncbi:tetratricopeptide repeat protein [Pseudotamlana agarivorans]|uniref:tetratricopeptide repeat protein n=1 Tax=Pseudotamlana agarivorans TaxID=481183 RepID=UPI0009FEE0C8|nr:tetratricopeptide repeat protein [Tamlana agarivorans]